MTVDQRQKCIDRVHSTLVSDSSDISTPLPSSLPPRSEAISLGETSGVRSVLSVDIESATQLVNIPVKCLEGIWAKAGQLIGTKNAIVPAPGQDSEARMVLSYSGKTPHMVTPKKGGDFSCDSSCPNWKSMGICSHSVAVAEVNGKLSQFLSTRKRKKSVPNVTSLLTTNMPKGRGRKGGAAPKSRKPSQKVTARIEMTANEMNFGDVGQSNVGATGHVNVSNQFCVSSRADSIPSSSLLPKLHRLWFPHASSVIPIFSPWLGWAVWRIQSIHSLFHFRKHCLMCWV